MGELIGLLAERGADLDRNRGKLLWRALISRKIAIAQLLIEHGASVDLRFAAGLNRADLMAGFFLPDGQPTPEANRLYRTHPDTVLNGQQIVDEALHYAVYNGAREAVELLLERGADINALVGLGDWDAGTTPLHKAVDAEDVEMIHFLLSRGADQSIADVRWEYSAYEWSVYYDNDAMRKAFVEYNQKEGE